jgi:hypothetical protein
MDDSCIVMDEAKAINLAKCTVHLAGWLGKHHNAPSLSNCPEKYHNTPSPSLLGGSTSIDVGEGLNTYKLLYLHISSTYIAPLIYSTFIYSSSIFSTSHILLSNILPSASGGW